MSNSIILKRVKERLERAIYELDDDEQISSVLLMKLALVDINNLLGE